MPNPNAMPFADLREHGLLWLVNRVVFHPRGYALALHFDDEGICVGWSMLGDGSEPWTFADDEDESFGTAEAFLRSLTVADE